MYGPENTDLVVKYYDEAFGVGSEHEYAWYLDKVRMYGGPVLDIGCGTGRLALRIAKLGLQVVGVDQSEGMLGVFSKKVTSEPDTIQKLIQIEHQSMNRFRINERFGTVICCDAFFHNGTVEDEISCLHAIREHLASEGRFVFNVPNPTCSFIDHAERSQGTQFSERGNFMRADGTKVIVEHAQAGDRLEQTIVTTLRVSVHDQDGRLVEQGESRWVSRYLYPYEAIHLLYRCGFEVEVLVGNYKGEPIGLGGQLIFQVKRR